MRLNYRNCIILYTVCQVCKRQYIVLYKRQYIVLFIDCFALKILLKPLYSFVWV